MSAKTTIEWCTRSWNPIRGCSRVSDGCTECYAMKFAHRFSGPGKPYDGLTTIRKGKVDWSGVARFIPGELDAPLRWKKPERIFVNSMSDLFHHSLSFEEIAAVFGVMAASQRHTFLVLTKRPELAVQFFDRVASRARELRHAAMSVDPHFAGDEEVRVCLGASDAVKTRRGHVEYPTWPLPNVQLGVSIEDQETADRRLPLLMKCPAYTHWASYEPALGPVDLSKYFDIGAACECAHDAKRDERCAGKGSKGWIRCNMGLRRLRWVVVGGESGPGARPFNLQWARDVVTQARDAPGWGKRKAPCPVFVKQFGAKPYEQPPGFAPTPIVVAHHKGASLNEIDGDWPREFPRSAEVIRIEARIP